MGEKPHALNPLIREGDCFSFVKLVSGFVSLKGVFFFLKVRTEVPKGFFGWCLGGQMPPLAPPPPLGSAPDTDSPKRQTPKHFYFYIISIYI